MSGLLGLLNLGTRSLQTQYSGVEVVGQNLTNVSNPAYARSAFVDQQIKAEDGMVCAYTLSTALYEELGRL